MLLKSKSQGFAPASLQTESSVARELRELQSSSDESDNDDPVLRKNPLARPSGKKSSGTGKSTSGVATSTAAMGGIQRVTMEEQQQGICYLLRIPDDAMALRHHAFRCISGRNPVRIMVYNITKHRVFEAIIILLILANCVFLAMDDPTAKEPPEYYFTVEVFFTVAFSAEMVLKMFSLGLLQHRGAYLREPWNVLDFLIVLLSYLNFIPGFGNYTAFRTLRVLRPLRSMNAIKGLKVLVLGLLRSFGGLLNVLFLAFFIFSIFGILGSQLWAGLFRRRCREISTGIVHNATFCQDPSNSLSMGYTCPAGQECIEWHNPRFGFLNFDNVLWSFLVIFQTITFENWTEVLFICYDVFGYTAFIYFFFLIMIGSYFVPNLALAVINNQFQTQQRKQELLDQAEEFQRRKEEQTNASKQSKGVLAAAMITPQAGGLNGSTSPGGQGVGGGSATPQVFSLTPTTSRTASRRTSSVQQSATASRRSSLLIGNTPRQVSVSIAPVASSPSNPKSDPLQDSLGELENLGKEQQQQRAKQSCIVSMWLEIRNRCHYITEGSYLLDAFGEKRTDEDLKNEYATGDSSLFTKIIIGFIFLNTVSLASQHHDQPQWHTDVLDYTNYIFTAIFGLEFLLKLTALGVKNYVFDYFNDLDAIIVIFSFVELFLAGSNTVSVFRALRLLRVLKLVKKFPSLRSIIRVVLNAMSNTVYLNMIMGLYLFIAALAGMQFFGGKLKPLEARTGEPIRAHFDTFLQAFYTVFQVLTLDKWVEVMWNAMEATNPAAMLYFVAVILVGVYVILSLFLAILISGFQKQGDELKQDQAELTLNARLAEIRQRMLVAAAKKFRLRPPDDPRTAMPILPAIQEVLDKRRSNLTLDIDVLSGEAPGSKPTASLSSPSSEGLSLHSPPEQQQSFFIPPALVLNDGSKKVDDREMCRTCRSYPAAILPAPPLVRQLTAEEHHHQICWLCELRIAKTERIEECMEFVRYQMVDEVTFSEEHAENVLNQLKLGQMMMNRDVSEFAKWSELADALEEELEVLNWEVGEEQIGGSLITYTRANMKHYHKTNGGDALFLFGPKNSFRVFVSQLVSHTYFDNIILCFICLSSLALAIDNPRDDQTTFKYTVLFYADIAFTTIFVLEMLAKIIARGLIMVEGAYLRDSWNILDCVIVLISVTSLSLTGVNIAFLKVFRTFRALRPLRVIHRNRGLKMVVHTLLQSVKGIANVAMLSSLNYLIFGILAVQLFSGRLYSCSDASITAKWNCTGHFVDPIRGKNVTRRWKPYKRNFDNIGSSVLTLFEVSAGELWVDIMYDGIDAHDHYSAPQRDYNLPIGLFFIIFFVISNFFMLNLFVGVVIHQFNSVKSQMDGLSLLTDEQKLWIETQRLMLNFRPQKAQRVRETKTGQAAGRVVQRNSFEAFIGAAIILNIVAIAMDHYGMDDNWEMTLQIVNLVFVVIFLVEAVMKLMAYGLDYFHNRWNQFDFFLVVISIVGVVLTFTEGNVIPIDVGLLRVFRIFRILRILRLVKQARNVRILIETLWYSLPSIGNISIFMLLMYFIYAVMGVQLFAKVQPGEYLNDRYANYQSFPMAMQMMFIFTTGEDWNSMMHDCMVREPDCEGDTCGTIFAPLFFTSFMLISAFVITNLFIAIILDNFETTIRLDKSNLTMQDLHRYVEVWSNYDPDASMFVETQHFPSLLADLQPPLGISRKYSRLEVLRKSSLYRVPERQGYVHFVEVLIPLARYCMNVDLTEREIREHEESWKISFPGLNKLPVVRYRNAQVCVNAFFCANYLAASFKRRRARLEVDKMRRVKHQEIARYKSTHNIQDVEAVSLSSSPELPSGSSSKPPSTRRTTLPPHELERKTSTATTSSQGMSQIDKNTPESDELDEIKA